MTSVQRTAILLLVCTEVHLCLLVKWVTVATGGPACASERILGQLASSADRFFQVERLYRFSAKFQPRWEPRYLLYEGRLGLPAAGLAVMWAERQLPKPSLARRPG